MEEISIWNLKNPFLFTWELSDCLAMCTSLHRVDIVYFLLIVRPPRDWNFPLFRKLWKHFSFSFTSAFRDINVLSLHILCDERSWKTWNELKNWSQVAKDTIFYWKKFASQFISKCSCKTFISRVFYDSNLFCPLTFQFSPCRLVQARSEAKTLSKFSRCHSIPFFFTLIHSICTFYKFNSFPFS